MKRKCKWIGTIVIAFMLLGMMAFTTSADTTSINPAADTYVFGNLPSANYGTTTDTQIKDGGGTAYDRIAYVKYDLGGISASSCTSAVLKLYCTSVTASTPIRVFSVTDDSWTETGITWSNMPATVSELGMQTVAAASTWYSFDITSFVSSQLAGDKVISLAVLDNTVTNTTVKFSTKEAASNRPVLDITYNTPTPTPTSTPTPTPTATSTPTPTPTPTPAGSVTYQVGPSRTYQTLPSVAGLLNPGDVVEVDSDYAFVGGTTFTRHGTAVSRITVKGIKDANGNRPRINGGTAADVIDFKGDFYTFEGFEVTGGATRGLRHSSDGLIIRDCVIHDTPVGIIGHDSYGGSLTVEYCELYNNGVTGNNLKHQMYLATSEVSNPGSVVRVQYNYIHDGKSGQNIKTRAERSEIYYNWLENPYLYNLELIGPDSNNTDMRPPEMEWLKREDADVVGNVIVSSTRSSGGSAIKFGGDGVHGGGGFGESDGRVRVVNNTFINKTTNTEWVAFRAMYGIDCIEMHNNVFYNPNGTGLSILVEETNVDWEYFPNPPTAGTPGTRTVGGSYNWVQTGATNVPSEWSNTTVGDNPEFADAANSDFRPAAESPLIDAGNLPIQSIVNHEFPNPLGQPYYLPPLHVKLTPGGQVSRTVNGSAIDIGAFEY